MVSKAMKYKFIGLSFILLFANQAYSETWGQINHNYQYNEAGPLKLAAEALHDRFYLHELKFEANNKNNYAWNSALGFYYFMKKDYKKALFYLNRSKNIYTSVYLLSRAYRLGYGTQKDCRKSYSYLKQLSGMERPDLSYIQSKNYFIGDFWFRGCGIYKRNFQKAINHFKLLNEPKNYLLVAYVYKKEGNIEEYNKYENKYHNYVSEENNVNGKTSGKKYLSIVNMFSVSPYSIAGDKYKVEFSSVDQNISRTEDLLSYQGSYYVGKFKPYAPPKGDNIKGYCVGIGGFKYQAVDGEIKVVPEVYFYKYKEYNLLSKNGQESSIRDFKSQLENNINALSGIR